MIRAYLRASTTEQDPMRAAAELESFAKSHGQQIAARYVENASGAIAKRPELNRMLDDALEGDIILVEAIDRITRLHVSDWQRLKDRIKAKGLYIVSLDIPTSHAALNKSEADSLTARVMAAMNDMLIEVSAAIARNDYQVRIKRQRQGIEKAKAEGKYRGRPVDHTKHRRILDALAKGLSVREVAKIVGCGTATVQRAKQLDAL